MDEKEIQVPEAWKSQYDLAIVDSAAEPVFGQQLGESSLIVHPAHVCAGQNCVIHNPSEHHMRSWPLNWRGDKGVMERTCPDHGIGHPDPDDASYLKSQGKSALLIHGCCGCC